MAPPPRPEAYPITAFSAVNALGVGTEEVLASLRAGRSGLRPCPLPLPFETWCGALPPALPPPPASLAPFDSRQCRLALLALEGIAAAARRAIARWGAERIAIVAATSTGGILETERAFAHDRRTGALPAQFDFD